METRVHCGFCLHSWARLSISFWTRSICSSCNAKREAGGLDLSTYAGCHVHDKCWFFTGKLQPSDLFQIQIQLVDVSICDRCLRKRNRFLQSRKKESDPSKKRGAPLKFFENSGRETRRTRCKQAAEILHFRDKVLEAQVVSTIASCDMVAEEDEDGWDDATAKTMEPPELIKLCLSKGRSMQGYLEERTDITKEILYAELQRQLQKFASDFHIHIVDQPQPGCMLSLQGLELIEANYLGDYLVLNGDGRNLSRKGQLPECQNTVIGFKSTTQPFYPTVDVFCPDHKTVLIESLKAMGFDKLIISYLNHVKKPLIACTDLDFIWAFADLLFKTCPWCGCKLHDLIAQLDNKRTGQICIEWLGNLLVDFIIDILHGDMRVFECIHSFVKAYSLTISAVNARKAELKRLYEVDDVQLTKAGELRTAYLNAKKRRALLEVLEKTTASITNEHIGFIYPLVSSFNSIYRLVTKDGSDIDELKRQQRKLRTYYHVGLEHFKLTEHDGIFYIHAYYQHASDLYAQFGNFKKFRCDEIETLNNRDCNRYLHSTDHSKSDYNSLKLTYGEFLRLGIAK